MKIFYVFCALALAACLSSPTSAKLFGFGSPRDLGIATQTIQINPPGSTVGAAKKVIACASLGLVLNENGQIFWFGQLYDNLTQEYMLAENPVLLPGLENEIAIDAACTNVAWSRSDDSPFGLILTASGRVYGLGIDEGALGITANADGSTYWQYPHRSTLPPGKFATQIWVFPQVSVIGFSDETLQIYGRCDRYCLVDTTDPFYTPAEGLPLNLGIGGVVDVSINTIGSRSSHALFCADDGYAYGSGSNYYSQFMISWLVLENSNDTVVQIPLGPNPGCLKVFATYDSSIILLRNGSIYAGGNNDSGILGLASSAYNAEREADRPSLVPFPPNFIVTHLAVGDFPYYPAMAWAIGINSVTKRRQIYTWGPDGTSFLMIPATSTAYTPQLATYLMQDTQQSDFPVYMYPAPGTGLLITDQGRVLAWQPSFSLPSQAYPALVLGLGQVVLEPKKTDIRNLLPQDFQVKLTFSRSVGARVLLLSEKGEFFLFTGDSQSKLISRPSSMPVRQIVEDVGSRGPIMLVQEDGTVWSHGVKEGTDGNTFDYYTIGNSTATDENRFALLANFEGLKVARIVPYLDLTSSSSYEGWMFLAENGSLFWLGSPPYSDPSGDGTYNMDSYTDVPLPVARSKIVPSNDSNIVIKDLRGISGSYFFKDDLDRWWGVGANNIGQLCLPQAANISPAQQLVAPNNATIIEAFQTLNISSELLPAAIFLTDRDEIYGCGAVRFGGIGSVAIPTRLSTAGIGLGSTKKISKFDVGLSSIVLQTTNDEIWTIGAPFSNGNWTRVDNRGAEFRGRVADVLGTVALGGGLISSSLRVLGADVFAGLSSVPIVGSSFGVDGDGALVDIFVWLDPANPIACRPSSRSARLLTCVLDDPIPSDAIGRTLYANVTVGDESVFNVTLGTTIGLPVLQDSVDQLIATNADEVIISGTSLLRVTQVQLFSAGCTVLEKTDSSIRCALNNLVLSEGGYLRAAVAVATQSISAAVQQPIARGVKRTFSATEIKRRLAFVPDREHALAMLAPTVTSSSDFIRVGTRRLVLKGEGFNPNTPSQTNSVSIRVDSGVFFPCAVLNEGSDASTLTCELSNSSIIAKSDGTIYATVRSYNGKSEERAVGVISLTGIASTTIAGAAIGGSIGALIVIVLIILIVLRTKIRKRLRDAKGTHVDVPQEMAHMFNIKSSDLEIIQKLGEGSFGAVFSAKWKGDIVALKKLTGSMLSSHVNDFFREAALMTGIEPHKNVIRIFGLCQELNNFSLVMELVELGSLDSWLGKHIKGKEWDPKILYRVVHGIARGMDHLARAGIVHRDLAARNVLLGKNYVPKISDFGMSRMVGADQTGQTASNVGPIKWMPPESLKDKKYSEKSDVWAFAVVLYELIVCHEPFMGEDLLEIAVGVRDRGRNVLGTVTREEEPLFPSYITNIMKKCFQTDPNDRPTFSQIVAELDVLGKPDGYLSDEEENKSNRSNRTNRGKSKSAGSSKDPLPPTRNYGDLGSGSAGKIDSGKKGASAESLSDPSAKLRGRTNTLMLGVVTTTASLGSVSGGLGDGLATPNPTSARSKESASSKSKTPRAEPNNDTNKSNRSNKSNKSNRSNGKSKDASSDDDGSVVVPIANAPNYGGLPDDEQPQPSSKNEKKGQPEPKAAVTQSATYGGLPDSDEPVREKPPKKQTVTVTQSSTYGGLPPAPETDTVENKVEDASSRKEKKRTKKEKKKKESDGNTTYGTLPDE